MSSAVRLGAVMVLLSAACSIDHQDPDDPGPGLVAACARKTGVTLVATEGPTHSVTLARDTDPGTRAAFEACLYGVVRPGEAQALRIAPAATHDELESFGEVPSDHVQAAARKLERPTHITYRARCSFSPHLDVAADIDFEVTVWSNGRPTGPATVLVSAEVRRTDAGVPLPTAGGSAILIREAPYPLSADPLEGTIVRVDLEAQRFMIVGVQDGLLYAREYLRTADETGFVGSGSVPAAEHCEQQK